MTTRKNPTAPTCRELLDVAAIKSPLVARDAWSGLTWLAGDSPAAEPLRQVLAEHRDDLEQAAAILAATEAELRSLGSVLDPGYVGATPRLADRRDDPAWRNQHTSDELSRAHDLWVMRERAQRRYDAAVAALIAGVEQVRDSDDLRRWAVEATTTHLDTAVADYQSAHAALRAARNTASAAGLPVQVGLPPTECRHCARSIPGFSDLADPDRFRAAAEAALGQAATA